MTTETKFDDNPLLVIGSMAFDDLDLPSGKAKDVVGGAATYASYASSLYTNTRIVAVVGDDFQQDTLDELANRGVDVEGVERAKGKTFRWAGRYAANLASRETLDTQLNVFADFAPKLPEAYRASPYVLLGNIHPALQLDVLSQVREPKLVAADTMNFWISGENATLRKVLAKVDTLIINDEEIRQLAEDHNIRRAARAVMAMGPRRLIVKRGDAGAFLFDEHGIFFAPAYPLEDELDPTGAGDTFAGAAIGFIARQNRLDATTLRQAVMIGAVVASFCVEGVGTRELKRVSHQAIAKRLDDLRSLLHLEP
jgi:sugar/nucleoside kinase (ribokinase family)